MSFQLENVTKVTFTNANVRRELHGEEHVRAVDVSMSIEGENTLLDLIEPGLREHHYCNRAAIAGQEAMPDVLIPLPNLRFPNLPSKINYASKQKWRGYRFTLDYGLGDEISNMDFSDCVLTSIWYELTEGGSVKIGYTMQYNGDELTNDAVYGRCAGLATLGEGHVQIIAPPKLTVVKGRGYRSGKPDTPPHVKVDDGTGNLLDQGKEEGEAGTGENEGTTGEGGGEQDTPEKALLRASGG